MRSPVLFVVLAGLAAGCGSGASAPNASRTGVVRVVASESFWGDVAAQLGGDHAKVTSLITDPNADPHLYESDARDAATLSKAQLVVTNGLGYDDFVDKLLSNTSSASRSVLNIADVLGMKGDGTNPHVWYDAPRIPVVAHAIVAKLR